ncbi:MAG: hypothetical protein WCF54_12110 [Terracidiphilus sp.]
MHLDLETSLKLVGLINFVAMLAMSFMAVALNWIKLLHAFHGNNTLDVIRKQQNKIAIGVFFFVLPILTIFLFLLALFQMLPSGLEGLVISPGYLIALFCEFFVVIGVSVWGLVGTLRSVKSAAEPLLNGEQLNYKALFSTLWSNAAGAMGIVLVLVVVDLWGGNMIFNTPSQPSVLTNPGQPGVLSRLSIVVGDCQNPHVITADSELQISITEGQQLSCELRAQGGQAPYRWDMSKLPLNPDWVSQVEENTKATLVGMAPPPRTHPDNKSFVYTVTDALGKQAAIPIEISIASAGRYYTPVQ